MAQYQQQQQQQQDYGSASGAGGGAGAAGGGAAGGGELGGEVTIELEHAIGFSGAVPGGLLHHPNGKDFVYTSGGCIVVCDFNDPHNQSFLRGHDGNISCLAVSKSGRLLASGQCGENSDVCVWDFKTRTLLYRFAEHDFGITSLSFSDDERLLVSIGDMRDKKMFVWDLATGSINASVVVKPAPTKLVAFGGMVKDVKRRETSNYLIATCGKGEIYFWSLNPYTGEMASSKVVTSSFVRDYTCMRFSEDREWLYLGTTTGDFACVSCKAVALKTFVTCCSGGVMSIDMMAKGTRLAIGGGDGSVIVYAGEGAEWVDVAVAKVDGAIRNLSCAADASEVLAGSTSGFIYRVASTEGAGRGSGKMRALMVCESAACARAGLEEGLGRSTAGGAAPTGVSDAALVAARVGGIAAVAYPANVNDRFATVSTDNIVRIWDASDYSVPIKAAVKSGGHPSSICYSPDVLLSGWEDGQVRCHSADTGVEHWNIANAHRDGVTALLMSNNQRFAVSGGAQGEVRVWELRSREMVAHLKEHTMAVTNLAMFDDDIHALSCSRDKSFLCWDLRREKRISSHTQRMGSIHDIALSQDQSLVLTVGQEKKITYWDLRERHPVQMIDPAHPNAEATCVAVSSTAEVFATGGTDSMVKLWDMRTGKLLQDGVGHSATVRGIQFSPDGRQLVSVGADGCVFVWNVYA